MRPLRKEGVSGLITIRFTLGPQPVTSNDSTTITHINLIVFMSSPYLHALFVYYFPYFCDIL